jgi:hypothetical protein
LLKRLSRQRSSDDLEALIVPHIEDDRASSLAATLDDQYDKVSLANLSASGSELNENLHSHSAQEFEHHSGDGAQKEDQEIHDHTEKEPNSEMLQSLTISTNPVSSTADSGPASPSSSHPQRGAGTSTVEEVEERDQQAGSVESAPRSPTSQTPSRNGLSKEVLPQKLSKVALSYRTNEWAKHLEVAEQPELEDLSRPGSPGVKLADVTERPAPVDDEIKGILPAKPQPERTSIGSKPTTTLKRSTSDMPRTNLTSSQAGGVLGAQRGGIRSSSTPLPTQMLETIAAARVLDTPSPMPSSTLLGKRESLTRNKVLSSSLTPLSSPQNLLWALDHENMTLAQRKQLIHRQKPPSASQQWRQSSRAIVEHAEDLDSHQPRRSSAGVDPKKREILLAGWRESMRQEGNIGQSTSTLDPEKSGRAALTHEKQQKEIAKQERALKAQQRESMVNDMMRSGKMLDAHREAMRRMQAKANKNV